MDQAAFFRLSLMLLLYHKCLKKYSMFPPKMTDSENSSVCTKNQHGFCAETQIQNGTAA